MFAKFMGLKAELGALNACYYMLGKILGKISSGNMSVIKYYLTLQPISNEPLISAARGKNLTIRQIYADDPETELFPRSSDVIQWRYSEGSICFCVFKDETFAGYIWLATEIYREDEVLCDYHPLPKGLACWDYDVYIVPKFRFSLAFAKLWEHANRYMSRQGVVGTVSRISAFNVSSLRSHKRLGARILASQLFLLIGSVQIMFSSISPYIHISTSQRKRAQVFINIRENDINY